MLQRIREWWCKFKYIEHYWRNMGTEHGPRLDIEWRMCTNCGRVERRVWFSRDVRNPIIDWRRHDPLATD